MQGWFGSVSVCCSSKASSVQETGASNNSIRGCGFSRGSRMLSNGAKPMRSRPIRSHGRRIWSACWR